MYVVHDATPCYQQGLTVVITLKNFLCFLLDSKEDAENIKLGSVSPSLKDLLESVFP